MKFKMSIFVYVYFCKCIFLTNAHLMLHVSESDTASFAQAHF